jgi:TetR/AcrR family transcriptional regulator
VTNRSAMGALADVEETGMKTPKEPNQKRDRSATREKILTAAIREFADKGLDGARVDEIAHRSGVNKNMLYHYFGNKEQLFTAVLERVYDTIRNRQSDLSIRGMEPEEGMRRLIEFTGQVWVETPDFIRLLSSENLHEARHVRQSSKIVQQYNPLLETISELLDRGVKKGVFREGIDPIDLYISISALTAHYVANRHTFEAIFRTNLLTPKGWRPRVGQASAVFVRYLRGHLGSRRA